MNYAVYILSNKECNIFYVGITGLLQDCIFDHKVNQTKRDSWVHCTRLLYYEWLWDFDKAVDRVDKLTKRLEHWDMNFIIQYNPWLEDESEGWYDSSMIYNVRRSRTPLIPPEWH